MTAARPVGSIELVRRFLRDRGDPILERELVRRAIASLPPLDGRRVLDVGCGPGLHARAMTDAGATVIAAEISPEALHRLGDPPSGSMLADAGRLPMRDTSCDAVLCSNMLEHTPEPLAALDEIERVLRPGGWAYVSWTNWYSPWGGHAIAPLHYLGAHRGLRWYRRLFGEPKGANLPFDGVWPLHIATVLDHLRARPAWRIVAVEPRYYPALRPLMRVPGLREVVAWNCLIRLERR